MRLQNLPKFSFLALLKTIEGSLELGNMAHRPQLNFLVTKAGLELRNSSVVEQKPKWSIWYIKRSKGKVLLTWGLGYRLAILYSDSVTH